MKSFLILLFLISGLTYANSKGVIKTNLGEIEFELYPDKAPKTVENFLSYVKDGFYNGTIFHRVIQDFMIQGGGFTKDMLQKRTKAPIENEASLDLKNEVGTLSMARTSEPHSATSQFFINTKDNSFLDFKSKTREGYGYAVFGKVTKGMSVVKKIEKVKTNTNDAPLSPIIIEKIEIKN